MKVLITRPRAQSDSFADALRSAGLEPFFFPVIEIRPIEENAELNKAIQNIAKYDWVVFTSVNAVDAFFQYVGATRLVRSKSLGNPDGSPVPQVAAIGPKTADALRQRGIEPDFVPEEYVAEAILPGLGDLQGKWVLLPRAEIARKELPEAILNAGGIAHEIIVYRTLPANIDVQGLNALKSGVDIVTFTSASTVENFVALLRQHKLDPLHLQNNPVYACIGPITEQAAREAGFQNIAVAKQYTTDGLLEVITQLETL